MSVREEVAYLRRVPLFAEVEEAHLNVLAFTAKEKALEDGEILFEEGKPADAAYLIMKGEAVLVRGSGKSARPVGTAAENDFLAEHALLTKKPYSASAVAKGRLEVLEITREVFLRSIEEFPEMGPVMVRALARRLDRTIADLVDLQPRLATGAALPDLKDRDRK